MQNEKIKKRREEFRAMNFDGLNGNKFLNSCMYDMRRVLKSNSPLPNNHSNWIGVAAWQFAYNCSRVNNNNWINRIHVRNSTDIHMHEDAFRTRTHSYKRHNPPKIWHLNNKLRWLKGNGKSVLNKLPALWFHNQSSHCCANWRISLHIFTRTRKQLSWWAYAHHNTTCHLHIFRLEFFFLHSFDSSFFLFYSLCMHIIIALDFIFLVFVNKIKVFQIYCMCVDLIWHCLSWFGQFHPKCRRRCNLLNMVVRFKSFEHKSH